MAPFKASGSGSGSLHGRAEFSRTTRARLVERLAHAVGVKTLAVPRCPGLHAPGVIDSAGVDRIEAQLVNQRHNRAFRLGVVARDCHPQPVGIAGWSCALNQGRRQDPVERLNDRVVQLPLDPATLRLSGSPASIGWIKPSLSFG